ncbi:MAG: response regulator transcription factor [Anaerolineae bacterium]|nr:response regulator transcription factor [Anaerolineae bacterium]
MQQQILFIVHNRAVETSLLTGLSQHYDVSVANLRRDALKFLAEHEVDLILIDVPSIRFNVLRFFESLKHLDALVLIFLLLGKGGRLDQAPHADGYLRHPVSSRQLLRRLSRILPVQSGEIISWKGLRLDTTSQLLMWRLQRVPLTPKQAALAHAFLKQPDTLLTRAQLMQDVWGTSFLGDTRTMDVHIHWFRKALTKLDAPFSLITQRRKGYILCNKAGKRKGK